MISMSTFQCRIFVQWSMVLVATLIFYSRSTSATRCGRILHSSSNHHAQHFQHSNQDTNRAEPLHHSHRSFVAPPLHFDRNLDHLSNRHHHSMIEHRLPTNQLHSIAPVPPTSHDAFRTSNDSNLTEQHSAFVRSASIQSSTLATLAGSPNESNAETVFGVRKRSSMSFLARSSPTNARLKPIIRLPVTPAIVRNTIEQAQPLVAYANEPVEHEIDSSSPLPHVSSSSSFIGPSASTNRRHRPTDNATSPEPGATHFPLLIHQGDAYIAYVGCALPNHLHSISMSIDRSAAGVQAAMSAVWAAHRYNQLLRAQLDAASSAFHSAIKLGVYHFELCAPTVNASALATSNQRKRFDELFRHVLHILRQSPADNRSSVFSFQPLIGLVLDVDSLSSKQLAQLAQLSLPVLTTRPTIAALVTSSGHSASRPLLLKTAASTSTLVAGLHQLISRLDWSTVHLSFCIETRSFDSNDSSNQTALFASLNNEQQAFAHEFSQFAARNSNFQLRLNQFTGQSLENEIVYLTLDDGDRMLHRLLSNHSSTNRLLVSLHPLRARFNRILSLISGHDKSSSSSSSPSLAAGTSSSINSSIDQSIEAISKRHKSNFGLSGGWLIICPKVQPPSDFFQFFQVELQKANVQSKHRLMALLADRMLRARSSVSSHVSLPSHPFAGDDSSELDRTKFSAPDPGFNLAGEYALQARSHQHNQPSTARAPDANHTLFHVQSSEQVLPVIQAVWALGFTLQQMVRRLCDHELSVGIVVTKEQRRTCLKKLNTNIQNGRARNITSSLDQRIPHKFAAIDGTASDSRMHFDTFGQLDSGDFELISLQNNRLIALGRLDAVNGLHSVDWNQVLLNLNSITANQLNELLKHTESTSESTFVGPEAKTQLPAPTVATPTYGMRLGVASVSAEEPEVKDMPDAEPEVEMLRPVSISTSTLESLTRPSSRIASEQNLDRRTSNLIKSTNRTVNSSSSRLFEHSVKEEDLAMDRRLATLILIFSTGGALATLYMFVYLLVKNCEGALRHHSHQALALTQLIAIVSVYLCAGLFVFQSNAFIVSLRSSVHNVALALLFAGLLQRALFLRAQKWIGLGGKISMLNQCLTLLFIFAVQLALEMQRWSYESPVLSESLPIWAEQQQLDNTLASYYLHSQAYLLVIASLLLAVSFSARAQPFTYKEGKHVYHTSLLCCPIYFLCVLIIYRQLAVAQPATHFDQPTALGLSRSPFAADLNSSKSIEIERSAASESAIRSSLHSQTNSNHRSMIRSESNDANASTSEAVRSASRNAMDHWRALLARKLRLLAVIQSVCLLCVATACLAGIFGPIALAIHRYGVLPKKPHSYADSLSTAFTLFKSGALPPAQEITGGQFALLTTSGKRTLATLNGITMINEQRSPNQPKSSAQSPSSGQSLTSTNSDSSMDNDYAAHNQDQHIVSELQARIQAATASSEIAYAQKIMNGSSMLRTLRNSLKSFSNNQTERLKSSERPTIPPAPPLPFSQTLLDRLSCASTGRSSSSDHYQSHVSVEQVNIGSGAQFNYATTPNYHRFKYVLNNLTEDLNQALHSSVTAVNTAGQLNEYVRNDLVRNPLYQDQQVNTAFRSAYP